MRNVLMSLVVTCGFATPALASHTLGYLFDETGTTAAADGGAAATAPTLFLEGVAGLDADLHGGPGSGVSGAPGDRALDLSSATAMGMSGGGRGRHGSAPDGQFNADFDSIDAFTSFTIAGWFKTDGNEQIGNNAVLVSNAPLLGFGTQAGYIIQGGSSPGTLSLGVDTAALSTSNKVQSSAEFGDTESWVNFAVTYDGSLTTDNVQFFQGTKNTPLMLTDTLSLDRGPVDQDTFPLIIGNTEANLTGFDGLIDNIRVWDFIVPLDTLQGVGSADAVPEPGVLAILTVIGGSIALRRRR